MNNKQKRFADEYLIDCNATRAYKAVYSNVNSDAGARACASKLLTNANVKQYIEQQLEKMHNAKIADVREIMTYLTSVMRGEQKEQCLKLSCDGGHDISDIDVGAKDRLKAAELLGKRYGMFTDKVSVEGNVPVMIVGESDIEE